MVNYQIKEMPQLTVIGKKQKVVSKKTSETIDRMVREMRELMAEHGYGSEKTVAGVCFHDPRFFDRQPEPDDEWWYMTGWLAAADELVPEGFERYRIEPQRYAVFTHQGNLSNLGKTYRYICLDWISEVDYEFYPADELNLFSEKYDPEDAESKIFI
jgi:AraC family transcriptional regulator